jgi:cell wall-associated NlpC family hydrolase
VRRVETLQNTTPTGALTRREAREIERRTGVRPLASTTASPCPTTSNVWDTGRIDRNEMAALLSVIPTELAAEAETAAATSGEGRGLTVRAERPAALVARGRRRTAGGFAAAASITALAAVGLTSVVGQGAVVADSSNHEADLLARVGANEALKQSDGIVKSDDASDAEQDATAEASKPAAESSELTEIESFDAASVSSAAAATEVEEPEVEVTEVSAEGSTETATDDTTAAADSSATASASTSGSSIMSIAEQYLGTPYVWGGTTPSGFDCAGYVAWVLNEAGYSATTSIAQLASMGTVTTDPQPGDLVIYDGHIGFYAGPNSMLHAPYAGDVVRYGTIDWGSHYFVHLG